MPVHAIDDLSCYVWECDECGAAGDDRMIERCSMGGSFMQAFCSPECEVRFVIKEDRLTHGRRGPAIEVWYVPKAHAPDCAIQINARHGCTCGAETDAGAALKGRKDGDK